MFGTTWFMGQPMPTKVPGPEVIPHKDELWRLGRSWHLKNFVAKEAITHHETNNLLFPVFSTLLNSLAFSPMRFHSFAADLFYGLFHDYEVFRKLIKSFIIRYTFQCCFKTWLCTWELAFTLSSRWGYCHDYLYQDQDVANLFRLGLKYFTV